MANSNGWGDGAANNSIGWGQGANNAIGWGDSHAKSWAGATDIVGLTTDPDAQAFITAAAITDPTQQAAIDNLVKGLKSDNIWTKMKAIYPFVGGTASTHKWNLKDPRDLDAAFRLVFNGGWTHSSNGATPNGTNGYADTKLVPSSVLALNSSHFSYYIRNNYIANKHQIFTSSSGTSYFGNYNDANQIYTAINDATGALANSVAYTKGNFIGTRIDSLNVKLFVNSTSYNKAYPSTSTTSANIIVAARNASGVFSLYSSEQIAFTTLGDGLNDTEALALNSRITTFQTALSRQI
jgi:hypothetical protein